MISRFMSVQGTSPTPQILRDASSSNIAHSHTCSPPAHSTPHLVFASRAAAVVMVILISRGSRTNDAEVFDYFMGDRPTQFAMHSVLRSVNPIHISYDHVGHTERDQRQQRVVCALYGDTKKNTTHVVLITYVCKMFCALRLDDT